MIELTFEQQHFKELFENFEEKREELRKDILIHMVAHEEEGHVPIPMDEDELNHPNPSTGAVCAVCQKHLGWYCPESPDHLCHYFNSINRECCSHCDMPLERK